MSDAAIHWLWMLTKSTIALLIILDPFGLLPVVIGISRQMTTKQRQRMLTRVVLIGFALLLAFTFTGTGVLRIFGITLDDMSISGGLLLLVVALGMVLGGHGNYELTLGDRSGIVPIASPLLVGPGAIAASLVIVSREGVVIASIAVFLAFFITWLVLRSTTLIYRILGESGSDVIARIMGLLLAALAIKFIREGVLGVISTAMMTTGRP